jgi:hypothetical protein
VERAEKMAPRNLRRRNKPAAELLSWLVVGPDVAGTKTNMRLLLALIVIIYLVGVGVVLSPVVRSTWNSAPVSVLAESVAQSLPDALAWPVRAARSVTRS